MCATEANGREPVLPARSVSGRRRQDGTAEWERGRYSAAERPRASHPDTYIYAHLCECIWKMLARILTVLQLGLNGMSSANDPHTELIVESLSGWWQEKSEQHLSHIGVAPYRHSRHGVRVAGSGNERAHAKKKVKNFLLTSLNCIHFLYQGSRDGHPEPHQTAQLACMGI